MINDLQNNELMSNARSFFHGAYGHNTRHIKYSSNYLLTYLLSAQNVHLYKDQTQNNKVLLFVLVY